MEGHVGVRWPLRSVGAWCGHSSIRSVESRKRDVALAAAIGLTDLHVMVNDHSRMRAPIRNRFTTYSPAAIIEFCTLARAAGIRVHLTSWVMPHESYLRWMHIVLAPLLACQATSLVLDAEEPWTLATSRWARAVDVAAELLGDHLEVPVRVTGIGYAPECVGELARALDGGIPQAYSTSTSKVEPHRCAPLVQRWRNKLHVQVDTCGLAAYRTTPADMAWALWSVRNAGVEHVIYWSLGHMRRSRAIRGAVANACSIIGRAA